METNLKIIELLKEAEMLLRQPKEGKISKERLYELCGGREPHRWDWTQEMLPDGWRPMLLGELPEHDDECMDLRDRAWYKCNHDARTKSHSPSRTRCPLPAPPTPKKRVPLEQADVPPGSFIRWKPGGILQGEWQIVAVCCDIGIYRWTGPLVTWATLMNEYEILRPGQDWQPCSKEEP